MGTFATKWVWASVTSVDIISGVNCLLYDNHLNNILHEGFIRGHFSLLHDGHGGSDPSDEHEFGPFAHFVAGLDSDVAEAALVVVEIILEFGEIFSRGGHGQTIALKLEHGPANGLNTHYVHFFGIVELLRVSSFLSSNLSTRR